MLYRAPVITIEHGDACIYAPLLAPHCDVMITDPPYSAHVHKSATSQSTSRGTRKRDLGFASLGYALRRTVALAASQVRRWSVIYSDVEHSTWLRLAIQSTGTQYIRTVPWVRWSMPQLSGDRPPQGFEHLVIAHPVRAKHWSGPGNLTALQHLALRGETKHKAEKPLDQCLDLVSWFSDPGETVLDLFSGSGTIALACRLLGRSCVAVELDARWVDHGRKRLAGPLAPRDVERVKRWLASPPEGSVQHPEDNGRTQEERVARLTLPAQARAEKRAADRAQCIAAMR